MTSHNDKLVIKAKFYLEPGSVKIQDFLSCERRVSGEEQFVFLVGHNPDDEAYLALQGLEIGQQRVGNPWQSVYKVGSILDISSFFRSIFRLLSSAFPSCLFSLPRTDNTGEHCHGNG